MTYWKNKALWIGLVGGLLLISHGSGAVPTAPLAANTKILLSLIGGANNGCPGPALFDFQQILPDGVSGKIFRVPVGNNFVVTDLDWSYVSPSGASDAGSIETARLFIQNLNNPNVQERGMESTITLSSKGEGGTSTNATTGFVVSSAARICPDTVPGTTGPPFGIQHMVVRGYLN